MTDVLRSAESAPKSAPQTTAWLFLLGVVVAEIALLRYFSVQQYMPLRESADLFGQIAAFVPAVVKASLFTGAAALIVFLARAETDVRRAVCAIFADHRPNGLILVLNLACFAALLGVFASTRISGAQDGSESGWLPVLMRLTPSAWAGMLLSWAGFIAPFSLWRQAISVNYLILAIIFLASLLSFHRFDAEVAADIGSHLIRPTLFLSSQLYALTGETLSVVGASLEGYPIYGSGEFFGQIGPSCSGYEGMFLAATLLGVYFYLEPRKLSALQMGFVILISCLTIFLLNSLRLAMLIYIGAHFSPEIAQEGFHQNFGLLSLVVVLVIAVMSTRALTAAGATAAVPFREEIGSATLKHDKHLRLLIPLIYLIASSLLCGLFSGKFFWLYPLPILAASVGLYQIRDELRGLKLAFSLPTFLLALATFLVWIYIVPSGAEAANGFQTAFFSAPFPLVVGWLGVRLLGAVIIVPLVEELAFRGAFNALLFDALRPYFTVVVTQAATIALTALFFGLVHSNVLAGALAGLAFGVARWRRNALADAVLCHGLTNLLLSFYILLTGDWSYWL
jgi:exosortase E/protease (VPEID-CTERM system)